MRIREATRDDFAAISRRELELFPDDAWTDEMILDEMDSPHSVMIVAEEGGDIIGYASAVAIEGNDVADIHTIAIVPDRRGHGFGAALLDELVSWCETRGASAVMLEVRSDNLVAQSLYRSRGFEPIAIRPRYYRQAGVDAIVMRREVRA